MSSNARRVEVSDNNVAKRTCGARAGVGATLALERVTGTAFLMVRSAKGPSASRRWWTPPCGGSDQSNMARDDERMVWFRRVKVEIVGRLEGRNVFEVGWASG